MITVLCDKKFGWRSIVTKIWMTFFCDRKCDSCIKLIGKMQRGLTDVQGFHFCRRYSISMDVEYGLRLQSRLVFLHERKKKYNLNIY